MTQRQITECDRCHNEIKGVARKLVRGDKHGRDNAMGEQTFDLCGSCDSKLTKLLEGADIEVPP